LARQKTLKAEAQQIKLKVKKTSYHKTTQLGAQLTLLQILQLANVLVQMKLTTLPALRSSQETQVAIANVIQNAKMKPIAQILLNNSTQIPAHVSISLLELMVLLTTHHVQLAFIILFQIVLACLKTILDFINVKRTTSMITKLAHAQ
jgi:hypothetical protein